jgi:hypothetical protein
MVKPGCALPYEDVILSGRTDALGAVMVREESP